MVSSLVESLRESFRCVFYRGNNSLRTAASRYHRRKCEAYQVRKYVLATSECVHRRPALFRFHAAWKTAWAENEPVQRARVVNRFYPSSLVRTAATGFQLLPSGIGLNARQLQTVASIGLFANKRYAMDIPGTFINTRAYIFSRVSASVNQSAPLFLRSPENSID